MDEGEPAETLPSESPDIVDEGTYTVEDAVEKIGYGVFQIRLMAVLGIAWMADAMELAILAIISPALRCEWKLTTFEEAYISTVVFSTMIISTCIWGYISDKLGRRKGVVLCTTIVFIGGILSSFAPGYGWIIVCLSLMGFGMGGFPQCMNLWAEFLPLKRRGVLLNFLSLFWSIGSCLEILLAMFVMPTLGWHWFLVISSLPLLLFLCLIQCIPESPRYYVAAGQMEKASKILEKIAKQNGAKLPPGKLVATQSKEIHRGRFLDLFSPEYRVSTILLWIIWFSSHFVIYGISLITTEMFSRVDPCRGITLDKEDAISIDKETQCKSLTFVDYWHYFIVMSGDIVGMLFIGCVVDRIGRKMVQAIAFIGSSVFFALLFICTGSRFTTILFLYGARLFVSIADLCGYVYTPELYPTSIRGIGLGACSGAARIGCVLTPFVAVVLLSHSIYVSLSLYCGISVLGIFMVFLLPIETKGRVLQDT